MIHMPCAVARGYTGVWGRSPQRGVPEAEALFKSKKVIPYIFTYRL